MYIWFSSISSPSEPFILLFLSFVSHVCPHLVPIRAYLLYQTCLLYNGNLTHSILDTPFTLSPMFINLHLNCISLPPSYSTCHSLFQPPPPPPTLFNALLPSVFTPSHFNFFPLPRRPVLRPAASFPPPSNYLNETAWYVQFLLTSFFRHSLLIQCISLSSFPCPVVQFWSAVKYTCPELLWGECPPVAPSSSFHSHQLQLDQDSGHCSQILSLSLSLLLFLSTNISGCLIFFLSALQYISFLSYLYAIPLPDSHCPSTFSSFLLPFNWSTKFLTGLYLIRYCCSSACI